MIRALLPPGRFPRQQQGEAGAPYAPNGPGGPQLRAALLVAPCETQPCHLAAHRAAPRRAGPGRAAVGLAHGSHGAKGGHGTWWKWEHRGAVLRAVPTTAGCKEATSSRRALRCLNASFTSVSPHLQPFSPQMFIL